METVAKENMFYSFSKDREAAVTVPSGTTLTLETYDCFENQVTEEGDNYGEIDWDRINPATGPVYIEEAEPGDCLKVTIDKIELADYGMMAVGKGLGVMKEEMEDLIFKKIPLRQNKGDFGYGISLDLNPMIGVIGVAPEGEAVSNGTPGDHGGNMDNKK
ncbi:acetamidase/formamidase family protein [Sinobaca sp. H24]|uniref:acetamidase/formamidase family protein n=1 Tax=Sinobaca sp. H24 TaxID=2923376 RepID=UPI00207A5323|nr:acetamidase/formamidase family protein [Sinobaca sp. H24]